MTEMTMTGGPYDEIRERVSCLDAARQYGLEVRRSGFCRCVFHADKKPSLKLYNGDKGFFCFACGEGGDVIKLTAQLLGLDRAEAARVINRDFALSLPLDRPPTQAEREQVQQRRKVAKVYSDFQAWKEETERLITAVFRMGWEALRDLPEPLWFDCEAEAIRLLPVLEDWLNTLAGDDIEKQMQIFRERKQVKEVCQKILNDFPERFKRD